MRIIIEDNTDRCACGWMLPGAPVPMKDGADPDIENIHPTCYVALFCPQCGHMHCFPHSDSEIERQTKISPRSTAVKNAQSGN